VTYSGTQTDGRTSGFFIRGDQLASTPLSNATPVVKAFCFLYSTRRGDVAEAEDLWRERKGPEELACRWRWEADKPFIGGREVVARVSPGHVPRARPDGADVPEH